MTMTCPSDNCKTIPYGCSSFVDIRMDNAYYVDKTSFIPMLEKEGRYLTLLRPRRYGKSLLLDMLAVYYDVLFSDQFDTLFDGLDISKAPTPLHSSFFVLRFNFSTVKPDLSSVQQNFNSQVIYQLTDFANLYKDYFSAGFADKVASFTDFCDAFSYVLIQVKCTGRKMYVFIDEYDNFANTLMSVSQSGYQVVTHSDGFFRLFFNTLKAATSTSTSVVNRILVCGVTPLTLSDVTSGYNIGINISLDSKFNSLVGFTESEFRQMLTYFRDATGVFRHSVDELIAFVKPWYDNNCFSPRAVDREHLYNSDLALNFVRQYIDEGLMPESMYDSNIDTDADKMVAVVRFEKDFGSKSDTIQSILGSGTSSAEVIPQFKLCDLSKPERILPSLLFYMGLLTYGRDPEGYVSLVVPNAVVRYQYFNYMRQCYQETLAWNTNDKDMSDLGRAMALHGDAEPLLRYVASSMSDVSSIRDFDARGESFIKGFFLQAIGCNTTRFLTQTEPEMNHGYSDLYLEPINDTAHAYVIELKYCKPSASDAECAQALCDGKRQLAKYVLSRALQARANSHGWQLHLIALVFRGPSIAHLEFL